MSEASGPSSRVPSAATRLWRPIETHPKDGRPFVAADDYPYRDFIVVVVWDADEGVFHLPHISHYFGLDSFKYWLDVDLDADGPLGPLYR